MTWTRIGMSLTGCLLIVGSLTAAMAAATPLDRHKVISDEAQGLSFKYQMGSECSGAYVHGLESFSKQLTFIAGLFPGEGVVADDRENVFGYASLAGHAAGKYVYRITGVALLQNCGIDQFVMYLVQEIAQNPTRPAEAAASWSKCLLELDHC